MGERTLKIIIYLAGLVSLFAFIATRSLPVMNLALKEKMIPEHFEFTRYGELYYQNHVKHFREELPEPVGKYRLSEKHPEPAEADVLMFGDSFLDISRQVTLPERLADSLGLKVFFHRFLDPNYSDPFCVLDAYDIKPGEPKVLVYQCVERNIPMKFDAPFTGLECGHGYFSERKVHLMREIFPPNEEEMYSQLLKRSILTADLFSVFATLKYDLFGYMSGNTPVYKEGEQPWLFLSKQLDNEPGSFYYQHSHEQIERYCDNIAFLQRELLDKLNMQLIFVPVPNKYTLYHTVVNDDRYNDFLPQLSRGLQERGVVFTDLYREFSGTDEILYYGTDTHWNKKGVDRALVKLVETMNAL